MEMLEKLIQNIKSFEDAGILRNAIIRRWFELMPDVERERLRQGARKANANKVQAVKEGKLKRYPNRWAKLK